MAHRDLARLLGTALMFAAAPLAAQDPARIHAFAERAFAVGASPGLGIAVVHQGRVIYQHAFGWADATRRIPATDQTLWYIASTSKSFTGFGIALLEAAGEVDVHAPITRTLPAARWHADVQPDSITLADFLGHTAGLTGGAILPSAPFTGVFPEAEWPALLVWSRPLPNRDLQYTNLGYNVASMVIDSRRREGWRAWLDRAVFRPAGMRSVTTLIESVPPERVALSHTLDSAGAFASGPIRKRNITMNSAGGHVTTIADLARWITIHMDEGRLDGRQIFPAALVRRSHEILRRHNRQFAGFQRDGWSMGWDIGSYEGDPMVSRFGSYAGTRSHISMLPGRRVGVVAEVNSAEGSTLTDIIAQYVYDVVAGRADADARGQVKLDTLAARLGRARAGAVQDFARRRQRPQTLPRPLADYTGTFHDPRLGPVSFTQDGNRLRARWGVLESDVEVFDATAHRLRVEFIDAEVVQFEFADAAGPASAIQMIGARFVRR